MKTVVGVFAFIIVVAGVLILTDSNRVEQKKLTDIRKSCIASTLRQFPFDSEENLKTHVEVCTNYVLYLKGMEEKLSMSQ